jgi:hypothetical protein
MDTVYMAQKIKIYLTWILYQKYMEITYLLLLITLESSSYLKGIKKTKSHLSKNLLLEKVENIRNFRLTVHRKPEPQQ